MKRLVRRLSIERRWATGLGAACAFTLLGAYTLDAQAACGELRVSKGDVQIESGKTKKAAPAPEGSKICSGDTIIAGPHSRAKIVMEDGNELNISPDSKIALEQYEFKPEENKKKVLLNVLSGKVRAATAKEGMYNDKSTGGQANTFQVRTKSAVAGVRGTDFLTGYNPATNKSEVVTFRGKVEFGQPGPGGQILNSVQVLAGQKTEVTAGKLPEPPKPVPPTDLDKMNSDTKADTAGVKNNASSTGAQASDGKKENGDNNRSPASNGGNGGRGPSMVTAEDTATGSGPVAVNRPDGPPPPPPPPPPLPPPVPKAPEQVTNVIQNGPSKLNVNIKFQ